MTRRKSNRKPKESLDVTSEPTNLVSCVSNAAMDTVHELAEQNGAKVLRVFIVLHLAEGPGGEIAEVCSASGTEISRDLSVGQRQLFALLLENARIIGRALGYEVRLTPAQGEVTSS